MADAAPAPAAPVAATDAVPRPGAQSQGASSGAGARGSEAITTETGKSAGQAKSTAPADDFKPFSIKANGKEHHIKSREQMERALQRGIPVQQSLEELATQRTKLEPVARALQQLTEGDDDSAMEVLESLLGERFAKVAEKRLMREVEREKKFSGFSERERQMAQQLEQAQTQRQQWERQQKEAQSQAQRQQMEQGVSQASKHIAETVGGALETLGLPRELGPQALAMVRPLIAASVSAGEKLDAASIAEELKGQLESSVQWAAGKLSGKALLDFFGPGVGKAYKAALLEQMRGGGAAAGAPAQPGAPRAEAPTPWNPRAREWVTK